MAEQIQTIEIELKDGQHVTLSKSKKDAQTLYNYMKNEEIETIHSKEPTIGDIFVYVTGRELI